MPDKIYRIREIRDDQSGESQVNALLEKAGYSYQLVKLVLLRQWILSISSGPQKKCIQLLAKRNLHYHIF